MARSCLFWTMVWCRGWRYGIIHPWCYGLRRSSHSKLSALKDTRAVGAFLLLTSLLPRTLVFVPSRTSPSTHIRNSVLLSLHQHLRSTRFRSCAVPASGSQYSLVTNLDGLGGFPSPIRSTFFLFSCLSHLLPCFPHGLYPLLCRPRSSRRCFMCPLNVLFL